VQNYKKQEGAKGLSTTEEKRQAWEEPVKGVFYYDCKKDRSKPIVNDSYD